MHRRKFNATPCDDGCHHGSRPDSRRLWRLVLHHRCLEHDQFDADDDDVGGRHWGSSTSLTSKPSWSPGMNGKWPIT
jgi:hypothetical protein